MSFRIGTSSSASDSQNDTLENVQALLAIRNSVNLLWGSDVNMIARLRLNCISSLLWATLHSILNFHITYTGDRNA